MLVNCVAYVDGRRLCDIEVEDIPKWRGQPGQFVWVALRDPSDAELATMQRLFGLHELAVEDVQHRSERPKVEEYEDMLFAVARLLEMDGDEVSQGSVAIFVAADFVLSIRTHSQQHFLGVRARCEREPELLRYGPGFVFYALIDAVVDRYFPVLAALEALLDDVESRIFVGGAMRENIQDLYSLKRKVTVMRHAVVPLMDTVGKLYGGRIPPLMVPVEAYFRDVYDHLYRVNAAIDAVRETIATAIQVNLSMVTIEQSDISKRLAAWASIFAVMTAFAGIWGMNFEHMPELKWTYGYPAALGLMGAIAGYLYWRFRKSGWL